MEKDKSQKNSLKDSLSKLSKEQIVKMKTFGKKLADATVKSLNK